jgi:hypothetical protein
VQCGQQTARSGVAKPAVTGWAGTSALGREGRRPATLASLPRSNRSAATCPVALPGPLPTVRLGTCARRCLRPSGCTCSGRRHLGGRSYGVEWASSPLCLRPHYGAKGPAWRCSPELRRGAGTASGFYRRESAELRPLTIEGGTTADWSLVGPSTTKLAGGYPCHCGLKTADRNTWGLGRQSS